MRPSIAKKPVTAATGKNKSQMLEKKRWLRCARTPKKKMVSLDMSGPYIDSPLCTGTRYSGTAIARGNLYLVYSVLHFGLHFAGLGVIVALSFQNAHGIRRLGPSTVF